MNALALTPALRPFEPAPRDTGVRALPALAPSMLASIRRRLALESHKWDAQVGDTAALAGFALEMRASEWRRIALAAERLTEEALAAEAELLEKPELLAKLGLPRAILRLLRSGAALSPAPGRVMRFDFHWTTSGWQISEANSDVPGGYCEASHLTTAMAEHYPSLAPPGDPSAAWCALLAAAVRNVRPVVALLSAPGYLEDYQIVAFLAARLRECGCQTYLAKPEQVRWRSGHASLQSNYYSGEIGLIVRFYQAEWLTRLPRASGSEFLLAGGKTAVVNGAAAILTESKRFPLVWDRLSTALPTWRALLPETRDPRQVPWSHDERWLLKGALSNNGDSVCVRELMTRPAWLSTALAARFAPSNWVAQRRFESVPIATPIGARHVCVGVFTVNGRAAGAYTRLARQPVVAYDAVDAGLLLNHAD